MTVICQPAAEIAQTLAKIRHVDAKGRGRRLRAAIGYAGLHGKDIAKRLHISESTLHRIYRGDKELSGEMAERVAAWCDLPIEFFDMDFWTLAQSPQPDVVRGLRSRLEAVERQLEAAGLEKIASDLEALQRAVRERP